MPDARWNDLREYDDGERGDDRPRVYGERDRDDHDPHDALMDDLPRGEERELVVDRDRVYELNGEDSRTLTAVGTFRVVPDHDLDIDHDTLRHLRDEGLVEAVELGGDERGLTLTEEGAMCSTPHPGAGWPDPAGVPRRRQSPAADRPDSNLRATCGGRRHPGDQPGNSRSANRFRASDLFRLCVDHARPRYRFRAHSEALAVALRQSHRLTEVTPREFPARSRFQVTLDFKRRFLVVELDDDKGSPWAGP
jgi:hypothetical protein